MNGIMVIYFTLQSGTEARRVEASARIPGEGLSGCNPVIIPFIYCISIWRGSALVVRDELERYPKGASNSLTGQPQAPAIKAWQTRRRRRTHNKTHGRDSMAEARWRKASTLSAKT